MPRRTSRKRSQAHSVDVLRRVGELWFAGDDLVATTQFGIGYATADIELYD